MKRKKRHDLRARIGIGLLGAFLAVLGAAHLYAGKPLYTNYWGGVVYAPLVVIIGIMIVAVVLFRWEKFKSRDLDAKGNEGSNPPFDDWHRW